MLQIYFNHFWSKIWVILKQSGNNLFYIRTKLKFNCPIWFQERMSDIKSLGKFYAKKCDISDEEQVKLIFAWIRDTLKNVHVLINNAGMSKMKSLLGKDKKLGKKNSWIYEFLYIFLDMPTEDMEQVVNLNLMGSIYCIREAAKLLKQNDEEAIILNINRWEMSHFFQVLFWYAENNFVVDLQRCGPLFSTFDRFKRLSRH